MERALLVVLGFDDADIKRLGDRKAEHAKKAVGGLASFFGGAA